MRLLLVLLLVAGGLGLGWLTGWIKPDAFATRPLDVERVGADRPDYRRLYFEAAVLRAGERLAEGRDAYIKAFARSGKLALCGLVVVEPGFIAQRTRAWLDAARLEIDGKRVPAGFIAVRPPAAGNAELEAGCALTDLDWRDDYKTAQLKLSGLPLLDTP